MLSIVGGGARSPVVCEIMAAVLGRPLRLGPTEAVGVTGAAMAGLAAIGGDESVFSAGGDDGGEGVDVIYSAHGAERDMYSNFYKERCALGD